MFCILFKPKRAIGREGTSSNSKRGTPPHLTLHPPTAVAAVGLFYPHRLRLRPELLPSFVKVARRMHRFSVKTYSSSCLWRRVRCPTVNAQKQSCPRIVTSHCSSAACFARAVCTGGRSTICMHFCCFFCCCCCCSGAFTASSRAGYLQIIPLFRRPCFLFAVKRRVGSELFAPCCYLYLCFCGSWPAREARISATCFDYSVTPVRSRDTPILNCCYLFEDLLLLCLQAAAAAGATTGTSASCAAVSSRLVIALSYSGLLDCSECLH